MKAKLEFDLPMDQEEFQTAQDGIKWKIAFEEFDQYLRDMLKHSDKVDISIQECRDKLWQIHRENFE